MSVEHFGPLTRKTHANQALHSAFAHVEETGGALHLFGLVSDGGVHSSDRHLRALLELAKSQGLAGARVVLHAFLDGRDTRPRSAHGYIEATEKSMQELGVGRVATIIGRYFAMDRDKRWERVQLAYDALTIGRGDSAATTREAIEQAYDRGENDEFVKPTGLVADGGYRVAACRSLVAALLGKVAAGG